VRKAGDAVPPSPLGFFAFGLLQQKGVGKGGPVPARPFCCLQTLQSALRLRPRRAVSSAGVNPESHLRRVFPVSVTVGLYREQGLGKAESVEGGVQGRRLDQSITSGVVTDALAGAKGSQKLANRTHAQATAFA